MGLPLNRALYDEDGNIYDIVAGNFLIVGLGEENFATLPADLMEKYRQQFEHPEQFIRIAGKILAVKQPVPSLEEQEAQRAQMAAQEALQEEIRLEDSTDLPSTWMYSSGSTAAIMRICTRIPTKKKNAWRRNFFPGRPERYA